MPIEIVQPACFLSQLKDLKKHYKNSEKEIDKSIKKLKKNPEIGVLIPNLGIYNVRKFRFPLRVYKIGKSRGLRIIYHYFKEKNIIHMVEIYSKTISNDEKKNIAMIKDHLKKIIAEYF